MSSKPQAEICALAGLRILRNARGLSLHETAKRSGMSPGYLQKLEHCQVKSPSPHKLARLAEVLHYDYAKMMELAGYPDPAASNGSVSTKTYDCREVLLEAARSADIGQADAEMLAQTIHEVSEAKKNGVDIGRDLLPRVVRSYRELHRRGLEQDALDEALAGVDVD